MFFSEISRVRRSMDAALKVFLCVVLAVSLCPPVAGAFAEEVGEGDVPAQEEAVDAIEGADSSDAADAADIREEAQPQPEGRLGENELTGDAREGQDDPASESDEDAVAPGAEEPEYAQTVLTAKADGVRAALTVHEGVALPEGAKLVVTPLVKRGGKAAEPEVETDSGEMDAQSAEEAIGGEAAVEDASPQALDADQAADPEDAATTAKLTGADVALSGMQAAVEAYRAKKQQRTRVSVVDAYAVEVLDAQGYLVRLSKDQADLKLVLQADEDAPDYDKVYAIERAEAGADATDQEAAAADEPVADAQDREFADEQEAAQAITYEGEAEDVTGKVQEDSAIGETSVEAAGAQDIVLAATVQDAQKKQAAKASGPRKAPSNAPRMIETLDTDSMGIVLNLFDYDAVDATTNSFNKDKEANKNAKEGQDGYGTRSGINTGKDASNQLKFYGTGDGVDLPKKSDVTGKFSNPGNGINQFTGGVGSGYPKSFYTFQVANQGIVQSTLTDATGKLLSDGTGFPKLNTDATDKSLAYLFDTNAHTGKKIYDRVNHLFKTENAGTVQERMVYDSNQNYAYYDTSVGGKGDFKVYESTYDRAGGSKSGMKYGFFPFDDWGDKSDCINPNENDWSTTNHPNHHLGLTMTTKLTMPYDGMITKGEETAPMVFEFSGDDDMWVFIDGKLVLDIGGIHQPVSGSIDFNTGKVKLGKGTKDNPWGKDDDVNNPTEYQYEQIQFSYPAIGITEGTKVLGDTAWLWDGDGHNGILGSKNDPNNVAGTTHVLQVFYLERGGCDSNLKISTNIHLMTKKQVSVKKAWENKPEDGAKVRVQLVRKAVGHDNKDYVAYAPVGEPVELSSGNSWAHAWSDLPSIGYNADMVYKDEGENVYCDYSYLVMEVPVEGYEPVYTDSDGGTLTVEQVTYEGIKGGAAYAAPVDLSKLPITVNNLATYIDVEKQWKNAAGSGNDPVSHDGDKVWVQLYKQTRANEQAAWSEEEAVGDPVELKKTNGDDSWKHRFSISETGDNVRYCVKEGVMKDDKFTPSTELPAAGKLYGWMSTGYVTWKPTSVSTSNHDQEAPAWEKAVPAWEKVPETETKYSDNQDNFVVVPKGGHANATILNKPAVQMRIAKVDATDGSIQLAGAKFDVYKDDRDGSFDAPPDTKVKSVVTGSTGVTDPLNVDAGATYWLVETEAPDGYQVREKPVKVVVGADGGITASSDDADGMKPETKTESGSAVVTVKVPDLRVYNLPSTAGPGVLSFLFLGAFIMALSLGLYVRRRAALLADIAVTAPVAGRR